MKDSLLPCDLRKNGCHTVHFLLQILVLSKLYRDIPVDQTDGITAVKLNMVRDQVIFLEDRRKRHSSIQHSISLNIQFLIHHHFTHFDAVEIRHCLIQSL